MASMTKISLLFVYFVLIFAIRCEAEPDISIARQKNFVGHTHSGIQHVKECVAIPIKVDRIYFKWNTNDIQNNITKYSLWYQMNGTRERLELPEISDAKGRTDYLLNSTEFKKGEAYNLGIEAFNSNGISLGNCLASFIELEKELIFWPFIRVISHTWMEITWKQPKGDLPEDYCQQMNMTAANSTSNLLGCILFDTIENITDLKPDTKYVFYGRHCIVNTKYCSDWSPPAEGRTIPSCPSSTSTFHPSIIVNLVAVMTVFLLHFFF